MIVAFALTLLILTFSWTGALAVGDDAVNASSCGIGAGHDANNNTLTCNFGLTPEELKKVIDAAIASATGPLLDRMSAISKTLGITEGAARTLLRIVGEQPDLPVEKLAEALTKVAIDYKRLQEQVAGLNPSNPTARKLVAQAKAEIDVGQFENARQLLRSARQAQLAAALEASRLREQAQMAEDAQMLGAASSTGAEADVALTERHYEEAATLFGQAAEYVPSGHPDEHGKYLEHRADALYRQGDERGDNTALQQSISTHRQALQDYEHERAPQAWAQTQNNLGNALEAFGERAGQPVFLAEALAAFHAALEVRTRKRDPLGWAQSEMNLGNALEAFGEQESGTTHLENALASFRAALEVLTREQTPFAWAITQMNLGTTYERLGERESGTAHLEEAVASFRAGLEVLTREQTPFAWAKGQSNLGAALQTLGTRESGTAHLEEAVASFRAALEELTRERMPIAWAMAQMNLGNALVALGERGSGTAHLEEAVASIRTALGELTRERMPTAWAMAQMNLGIALGTLGKQESGTAHLEEAVTAWKECLTVTVTVWPPKWNQFVRSAINGAQIEIARRSAK
jgi:tetratricopeptide (TPR) repeat protein